MYEYKIEKLYPFPISEEQLSSQGLAKWELVSALTVREPLNITETYVYYFKRKV